MNRDDMINLKEQFKRNEVVCEKVINTFSMVSNKTRFRILCLLSKDDFCVSDIVDTIQHGSFSNVSQQLKLLTLNGIITKKRERKKVIYHLENPQVRQLIQVIESIYLAEECQS